MKHFSRFDDKPMITRVDAVSKSLQRYCMNGEFCIASGDGTNFTRYYLNETIPFFDVTDISYWLVDKSLKPSPKAAVPSPSGQTGDQTPAKPQSDYPNISSNQSPANEPDSVKKFKSITVSGKVPLERHTELFNYFITPFAMSGNKIDIEVSFKIYSNVGSPIDESKQQYKSAKEAARQLKLDFNEEV